MVIQWNFMGFNGIYPLVNYITELWKITMSLSAGAIPPAAAHAFVELGRLDLGGFHQQTSNILSNRE